MQLENERINILMVDDNLKNLLALEAILSNPDRNLVRASSGDEALRYLLDHDVAVILLDVYMPGLDGLETAELIRGREKSRDIPIIFLTADSSGAAHLSRGYSLGAVDYILKPVEPEILRSKVGVFVELYKKTQQVKRQAELLHEKNIELENANLQRLGALVELGQQLAAERDPARLLEKFCHRARDIVGAQYAAVGVLNEDGRSLRHCLTSDSNNGKIEKTCFPQQIDDTKEIFHALLVERRPLRLHKPGVDLQRMGLLPGHEAVDSFLGAPIFSPAGTYGWLSLANKLNDEKFNEADERLAVTLAAQVAVTYENAKLYTEVQGHAAELAQEVAERKAAEQERAQLLVREQAARREAEQANRTKDEFLATLSHELRTPLTSILGWTHLLRGRQLDEASAERALETIQRNAKSQSQLIDDLLDVSRIITGKLRIDVRQIEIKPIIEAAVESIRPAADANSLEIITKLDETIGPVMGDPNRMQQVVWNLLSNSVKFTPRGGRIEVKLEQRDAHAVITVSDTGQGISPDFLPHIFDRFRQADGTTTRAHGGLGLGLAIVRHMIELHHGTVHAESAGKGQGATFTIKLPLIKASTKTPDAEQSQAADANGASQISPLTLDGLQVLVVDDEADTRDLITTVLARCGAEVRTSASASEALETLKQWAPDVLISDIGMPGEDGYALIRKVRGLNGDQNGGVPAVALTAYASVEDRTRAISAGFHMHMAKPVEPTELVAVVAKLAGRRS